MKPPNVASVFALFIFVTIGTVTWFAMDALYHYACKPEHPCHGPSPRQVRMMEQGCK